MHDFYSKNNNDIEMKYFINSNFANVLQPNLYLNISNVFKTFVVWN